MAFNIRDSVTRIQHTALDTEKLLSPLYKLKKKKNSKMNVHTGKDEFCSHGSGSFYLRRKWNFDLSGLTFLLDQILNLKTKCSWANSVSFAFVSTLG